MNLILSHILLSFEKLFNDYDFYTKHPQFIPNNKKPFGEWKIISKDDTNYNYTLQCFYSYNNGYHNEIAVCTVYIVNAKIKVNEIEIRQSTFSELEKFSAAANYY